MKHVLAFSEEMLLERFFPFRHSLCSRERGIRDELKKVDISYTVEPPIAKGIKNYFLVLIPDDLLCN